MIPVKPMILGLVSIVGCQFLAPVSAQEFRVQSQTFVEHQTMPVTENLTLFTDGMIFDFQLPMTADQGPGEVVMFDVGARKLTLLDAQRKIKLELPDIQLLKLLDGVRRETLADERTRFLVEDEFTETIDTEAHSVTLTSPTITYKLIGAVADTDQQRAYFDFLDNFTRLNASDPKKLPPFPRIRLNQSIRRVGWLPTRVDVTIQPNALFQETYKAHSMHEMSSGLTAQDRDRIRQTKQDWSTFRSVSLAAYRGFPATARFTNPFKSKADSTIQRQQP